MVGMARCAVPARVVAGGTNIRGTLAIEGFAPLHAAQTSQRDVPTTLNRYSMRWRRVPIPNRDLLAARPAVHGSAQPEPNSRKHPTPNIQHPTPNGALPRTWFDVQCWMLDVGCSGGCESNSPLRPQ